MIITFCILRSNYKEYFLEVHYNTRYYFLVLSKQSSYPNTVNNYSLQLTSVENYYYNFPQGSNTN